VTVSFPEDEARTCGNRRRLIAHERSIVDDRPSVHSLTPGGTGTSLADKRDITV